MLDSKQNLINAAIRPFHNDAEMEMAASHLLGEMVPDAPAGAEDAIARWQDVDARARKPLWGLVLAGLMIAVTAWVVFKDFHEVVRYVKWSRSLGGNFFVEMPEVDSSVMDRLRPNEKLLLQGSILGVDPLVPKEAMWRSDPENPAFYTEYASAHVSMHDKLPADFLETVQRIDPQNSWFTYLAASLEAKESVKRNKRKSSRVAGKIVFSEPVSWEILDQAKMDRVMDLVHKAEAQEKFDNYSREMFRKRIKLLPDTSLIERMDLQMCVYMRGSVNNLRLRFIVDVIAAKASSAADAGDKQGFLDAKKFGEHYMATMMQSATTSLVDELILNMAVGVLTESLASGSEKLGLVEEAQRWRSIYDRIDSRNQSKGSRKFIVDGRSADPAMISGGLFGGTLAMVAKQPEYQPRLTDADLMPGRLLDHEILSRFLSYLSWVLVLFILLSVTLYRYRVSCLARKLVSRTEKLLLPRDWLWLIGAGILLPLIIVMAVNRLTPLGGRQFGMMGTTMMLPLAHFLGVIVLWLTVPVQVARWRLAKRAKALGFARASWLGWLVVVGAAAFIPLIGWVGISHSYPEFWQKWISEFVADVPPAVDSEQKFWIALGCLGVPILWVIFCISRALLSQTHRIIQHAVVARVLVKPYLAAMLLLSLATVGFKASEGYWFARENLGKLDPAKPGCSVFEYDVAVQMREELREILEAGGS